MIIIKNMQIRLILLYPLYSLHKFLEQQHGKKIDSYFLLFNYYKSNKSSVKFYH